MTTMTNLTPLGERSYKILISKAGSENEVTSFPSFTLLWKNYSLSMEIEKFLTVR